LYKKRAQKTLMKLTPSVVWRWSHISVRHWEIFSYHHDGVPTLHNFPKIVDDRLSHSLLYKRCSSLLVNTHTHAFLNLREKMKTTSPIVDDIRKKTEILFLTWNLKRVDLGYNINKLMIVLFWICTIIFTLGLFVKASILTFFTYHIIRRLL